MCWVRTFVMFFDFSWASSCYADVYSTAAQFPWTVLILRAQIAMSKNGIYLAGVAILGAIMGYFPDVFRDPIRFIAGAIYLVLLHIAAHTLEK